MTSKQIRELASEIAARIWIEELGEEEIEQLIFDKISEALAEMRMKIEELEREES